MKRWLIGLGLVVGGLFLTRSPLAIRIGNRLRALSDEVMLGLLRLSSEFESEQPEPTSEEVERPG